MPCNECLPNGEQTYLDLIVTPLPTPRIYIDIINPK